MKNPKVLYIIISILCFMSVVTGIYAQFFVKEEDKTNVILPHVDHTSEEDMPEKTAEEIKTQFSNLFNNAFSSGDSNLSNITKIDAQKDIVYCDYNLEDKKENYEVDVHLPTINIKGEATENFNKNIHTMFGNKAQSIISGESNTKVIYQIKYTAYINGDILSVAIEGNLKEGSNPQRILVQTYNYNLVTGEKVALADILTQKNLIQSDVQKKIKSTVEKEKDKAEVLIQSGYPVVYNRELDNEMYNINNVSDYFLGSNGELYIIFAYGNQNYTSEMDIVLYE